jgi:hypothetical protein
VTRGGFRWRAVRGVFDRTGAFGSQSEDEAPVEHEDGEEFEQSVPLDAYRKVTRGLWSNPLFQSRDGASCHYRRKSVIPCTWSASSESEPDGIAADFMRLSNALVGNQFEHFVIKRGGTFILIRKYVVLKAAAFCFAVNSRAMPLKLSALPKSPCRLSSGKSPERLAPRRSQMQCQHFPVHS